MKKNKHLDKIINQTLKSVIKKDQLDFVQIRKATNEFKKLSLTDSIYALSAFQKGLTNFLEKHTLTVYAPVELPKNTLNQIQSSLHSTFNILNSKFILDSSLLAGFKFKIGDTIFDSSLRSAFKNLNKTS